jgi:hypothetical protein
MNHTTVRRLVAVLSFLVGGGLVSAQIQLPSSPAKQFGASITPAYEGWFDNPDGSHSFLIGYYSRNTQAEVDVPIGPDNHFEPGNQDMGQPTHFLTRRRFGMFVVTVPREFAKTQKLTWTLTANGVTTSVPFHMHTDYNLTPFKSSEESPNREFNHPPVLRFTEAGATLVGPIAAMAGALERSATAGVPMPLDLWADDDALYSSGGNAPLTGERPPVNLTVSKYRGPGNVAIADAPIKFTALKGGKPAEPYSGKASTTVNFDRPGDYVLHLTANDYSGNGGGGSGCCWTTVMIKVAVKAGAGTSGGQ